MTSGPIRRPLLGNGLMLPVLKSKLVLVAPLSSAPLCAVGVMIWLTLETLSVLLTTPTNVLLIQHTRKTLVAVPNALSLALDLHLESATMVENANVTTLVSVITLTGVMTVIASDALLELINLLVLHSITIALVVVYVIAMEVVLVIVDLNPETSKLANVKFVKECLLFAVDMENANVTEIVHATLVGNTLLEALQLALVNLNAQTTAVDTENASVVFVSVILTSLNNLIALALTPALNVTLLKSVVAMENVLAHLASTVTTVMNNTIVLQRLTVLHAWTPLIVAGVETLTFVRTYSTFWPVLLTIHY